jgi:hypothetical protein
MLRSFGLNIQLNNVRSGKLKQVDVGCHICDHFIGYSFYAVNTILLSPSAQDFNLFA